MKKGILAILFGLSITLLQGISPYILLSESKATLPSEVGRAKMVLQSKGYRLLGEYAPGGNKNLHVLTFTHSDLQGFCKETGGACSLAGVMKLGFQRNQGTTSVSLINPEYLFYAYFRDRAKGSFEGRLLSLSSSIKTDLSELGKLNKEFGGDVKKEDLVKYRYMVGMPRFDDRVELGEFDSFEQGLGRIRRKLTTSSGDIVKVYEFVDTKNHVAIFGIGLANPDKGEAHFLPIIGEAHVAAMPYELILEGNEATMLHGRFRFALHWPELTMGTFTKIMSSPGDVEEALKVLVD